MARHSPFGAKICVLVAVLSLGLLAGCARGLIPDWPWGGGRETPQSAVPAGRPAADRAINVRIRDEDERGTLRLTAIANEVLTRHGFRPDGTAEATLVLRLDRPRSLAARGGPGVGVFGSGGSSGTTNLGLAIEIPLRRGESPPAISRHELIAELENAAGKVVWRETAVRDAAATAEIDPAVSRELLERIVARLAAQAARQDFGAPK